MKTLFSAASTSRRANYRSLRTRLGVSAWVILSLGAAGCTDLAMQNYDHALKNRQITPTEYRQAREDLDRRSEEYSQSKDDDKKMTDRFV